MIKINPEAEGEAETLVGKNNLKRALVSTVSHPPNFWEPFWGVLLKNTSILSDFNLAGMPLCCTKLPITSPGVSAEVRSLQGDTQRKTDLPSESGHAEGEPNPQSQEGPVGTCMFIWNNLLVLNRGKF